MHLVPLLLGALNLNCKLPKTPMPASDILKPLHLQESPLPGGNLEGGAKSAQLECKDPWNT